MARLLGAALLCLFYAVKQAGHGGFAGGALGCGEVTGLTILERVLCLLTIVVQAGAVFGGGLVGGQGCGISGCGFGCLGGSAGAEVVGGGVGDDLGAIWRWVAGLHGHSLVVDCVQGGVDGLPG